MSINADAQWYYARGGTQTGPFELAALRSMVAAGQLTAQDLVWCDGMPAWMPISQVPELKVGGFPAPNFSGQTGYPTQQSYPPPQQPNVPQQQQYAPQQGYTVQSGYASPASPGYNASAARGPSQQGMAIAGFVLSLLFPLLGLIFSLIALNGMKTNRNEEGKGYATAGLIISIIFLVLTCLWVIAIFGIMGAAASSGAGR